MTKFKKNIAILLVTVLCAAGLNAIGVDDTSNFKVNVFPEGVALFGFSMVSPGDGTLDYLEPFNSGKIEFKDPSSKIATGSFYVYYRGNSSSYKVTMKATALTANIEGQDKYQTYGITFNPSIVAHFDNGQTSQIPADALTHQVLLGTQQEIFSSNINILYRKLTIKTDFSSVPELMIPGVTWTGTLSLEYQENI